MGIREELSVKIAGEIVLSAEPSKTIKKWRKVFGISQVGLASNLEISPSVVSDYESGRRRSPGATLVKKLVNAFISEDERKGSRVLKAYERTDRGASLSSAVLDMREFPLPVKACEITRVIAGTTLVNEELLDKDIYGYTVLDSVKAILELSSEEFLGIYGMTSERALIFTNVSMGRSPFVAIRVSTIKPGLVVLHGLKEVDPLGLKIAAKERVPVVLSRAPTQKKMIQELRRLAC
ncbi:MAG: helix-turn-helix domain-containing protein [Candidatus Hydrothermarchaeota archaeon]|nr:helix-turn-helix domain-containing protein [Candidatus Hydrothermarchaeota archaeon]